MTTKIVKKKGEKATEETPSGLVHPESMDIKKFILSLEMLTEVEDKGDLLEYNQVKIPVRKEKIQILLPGETIQIPLDKLFTEDAEKDRRNAYYNRRFNIFQDLGALGCFKQTKFPSQNSQGITLMIGWVDEETFRRIYNAFMKAYPQKAGEIKRLAGVQGKFQTLANVLTKNPSGDYFYEGKRIDISRNTIYYDVFDILFLKCDQGGFLSYEDIEAELIKRGRPPLDNAGERNKRIQNAVTNKAQGFFKHAKINGKPMHNGTLDGKELIEIVRGMGLRLNNPIIAPAK